MSENDDARNAIAVAIEALRTRSAATTDANEKETINETVADLHAQRAELNQAELAASAQVVADATAALQDAVKAAQAGPFDAAAAASVAALKTAVTNLQSAQADVLAPVKLYRTEDPPPVAVPAEPGAPADAHPPVGAGRNAEALAGEYQACFDACVPAADRARDIQWYCDRVTKFRAEYAKVGDPIGVPWYFIGVIHGLECSFNFGTHLHNGDKLSARTVHVPKGRPPAGGPPFDWAASAADAMACENFANLADWSLPRVLFRLEAYNGFGYRARGLRTPYLWSFSNLYASGKYVGDGDFDANAVSDQCGAAVMLKALVTAGALQMQGGGVLG